MEFLTTLTITVPEGAPAAPQTEMARFREGPSGNVVVTRESVAGNKKPAARPWTARPRSNRAGVVLKPPSIDATPNSAPDAMKTRRRPSRSDERPPKSRKPPNRRA